MSSVLSRAVEALAERDPGLAFALLETQLAAVIVDRFQTEEEIDLHGRGPTEYEPVLILRSGGTERVPTKIVIVHEDYHDDEFAIADYEDGTRLIAAPSFEFGVARMTDAIGTRFEIVAIEGLSYRRPAR